MALTDEDVFAPEARAARRLRARAESHDEPERALRGIVLEAGAQPFVRRLVGDDRAEGMKVEPLARQREPEPREQASRPGPVLRAVEGPDEPGDRARPTHRGSRAAGPLAGHRGARRAPGNGRKRRGASPESRDSWGRSRRASYRLRAR